MRTTVMPQPGFMPAMLFILTLLSLPGRRPCLLDHLIRPRQERRWDRRPERLGDLEVDDELKLRIVDINAIRRQSLGLAPRDLISHSRTPAGLGAQCHSRDPSAERRSTCFTRAQSRCRPRRSLGQETGPYDGHSDRSAQARKLSSWVKCRETVQDQSGIEALSAAVDRPSGSGKRLLSRNRGFWPWSVAESGR